MFAVKKVKNNKMDRVSY